MSDAVGFYPGGPTIASGRLPVQQPTPSTPAAPTPVPAAATAPVYQPWVTTIAQAESAIKTHVNEALREFNQDMQAAERILNTAAAISRELTAPLEAAAWSAYQRYTDEAARVSSAIMGPATKAYDEALKQAHNRLEARLTPAEQAYKRATTDANYAKQLGTQGATMASG